MAKYHDHLSESLGIENEIEEPKQTKSVSVVKKNPTEPMLFDTNPPEDNQAPEEVSIVPENEAVRDAKDDYREVRGRLHQLAETGNQALEGILKVAEETEHPRAYEVVAQLIKTLAENSNQLMQLHHNTIDFEEKLNKKKEPKVKPGEDEQQVEQHTHQNAFFFGSTADVQKMIEKMTKEQTND